jgi:uncharacterized protein (DUF924 family)
VDAESVLEHWLGVRNEEPPTADRMIGWFATDPKADDEIRLRFGALIEQAVAGKLTEWESEPADRAALIILLDQFQRNLFRGTARAFDGDERAIEIVRRTNRHELNRLHPLERYFAIMPWMHTECLEDEREGEKAYSEAAVDVADTFQPLFENGLRFATRHRVVIERFGRFPHRNAVLGRDSTAEERAYLDENSTGF